MSYQIKNLSKLLVITSVLIFTLFFTKVNADMPSGVLNVFLYSHQIN